MSYLKDSDIKNIGFKSIGRNVKISDKASIYNPEEIEIGDNSRIDDFCVISGNIKIGRNIHITPHCLVAGGKKGIIIDDFATLAYFVKVFSQSDDYSGKTMTNSTIPTEFKNEYKSCVHIGRHVIIGTGSTIFPGVVVAEGCSIGAMTLVNKSTEPWGIYVGNPAKRIKDRSKDLLVLEQKFLETNK